MNPIALSNTPTHDPNADGTFPLGATSDSFVDRRSPQSPAVNGERRQFGSSHAGLTEAGRELAMAIDAYKVQSHRRYITCDEMLGVLTELGYKKV